MALRLKSSQTLWPILSWTRVPTTRRAQSHRKDYLSEYHHLLSTSWIRSYSSAIVWSIIALCWFYEQPKTIIERNNYTSIATILYVNFFTEDKYIEYYHPLRDCVGNRQRNFHWKNWCLTETHNLQSMTILTWTYQTYESIFNAHTRVHTQIFNLERASRLLSKDVLKWAARSFINRPGVLIPKRTPSNGQDLAADIVSYWGLRTKFLYSYDWASIHRLSAKQATQLTHLLHSHCSQDAVLWNFTQNRSKSIIYTSNYLSSIGDIPFDELHFWMANSANAWIIVNGPSNYLRWMFN